MEEGFKEIGEAGLKEFRKKARLGDTITNHYASEHNPQRTGYFIGIEKHCGITCVVLTNLKANKKWYPVFDKHSKLEIFKKKK